MATKFDRYHCMEGIATKDKQGNQLCSFTSPIRFLNQIRNTILGPILKWTDTDSCGLAYSQSNFQHLDFFVHEFR